MGNTGDWEEDGVACGEATCGPDPGRARRAAGWPRQGSGTGSPSRRRPPPSAHVTAAAVACGW